jgi:UPF0755 protein
MIRTRFILAALAFLLVSIVGAGASYFWFAGAVAAPGPLQAPASVIILPGEGLSVIANRLVADKVIGRAWLFELEARRVLQTRALKPGEYQFDPGISTADALKKIVGRDVVVHFVTLPEGIVTADILRALNREEALSGEITITIEHGDLLPETYSYERGDTRTDLIERMHTARDETLERLWAARPLDLPFASPEEAVILASIVEKETGVDSERRRVAAVFVNRLRRGMRLQSDPTVIYGLAPESGNLGRPLTRRDLAQPTPYNTYVIDGLPPGPICHPGREAITAVLNPFVSQELYFVADGTGGHVFARTLREHNQNVNKWRRIQREQRARHPD